MKPGVGAKVFTRPRPREDEGCEPRGGLAVCLAGDRETWIGEERTG